ncbi:MAG: lipoyl synthase [Candidatus Methylopumilus sp.]|nr:lipoyl synthase [Candidatus Methylopumilus sp.]
MKLNSSKPIGIKETNFEKTSKIPIKIIKTPMKAKPHWIKMQLPQSARFNEIKSILRKNNLHSVCEEASCPNISECFSQGTATFMILGDLCTRRCPFCDVGHGRPLPPDSDEPIKLAETIKELHLNYVVITSVDRDDLRDGGAQHFVDCIKEIRLLTPGTKIEILVPDFRGRLDKALEILSGMPPDVFNHNLETTPRLYKKARPGSDYLHSLQLLSRFKLRFPNIPTKSGLMLGLGETTNEIIEVMKDLRSHQVDMLTLGQYLQPSPHHLPVDRYVDPLEFNMLKDEATRMKFSSIASAPMVRSSYHADLQAHKVHQ